MTPRRCLCSHIRSLHPGDGKCCITSCGCDWYRLDYRSSAREDTTAAEEGAA